MICFQGSLPHGGEGASDGVVGEDVFPVLGRETLECRQLFPVFDQHALFIVVYAR
jgi:hypothetical protein